jgi:hypothetical protein
MKLVTLALVLSFSNVYAAGGDSGNGGGGIVCLNANGERTVKLLDLREAEKNPALTIARSNKPWALQLEAALQKYSAVNADYVKLMRAELSYMADNTIMEDALRLPPPNDTRITDLNEPRNCFLEGVANYDDLTGKLSIDSELEALMSETDRAALRFHEAWYRVQRVKMSPTDNSLVARKVTGMVFAQEPLKVVPVNQGAENAISTCTSEDSKYSFHVVPKADGEVELMFTRVSGINLGERTAVIINRDSRNMDGDILNSLSEGFKPVTRASSKDERKNRAGSGIDVLAQKSVYVSAKASLSAPMHLLISTSDLISNLGDAHMEQFTRVGHTGGGYAWSWKVKKPTVYENVGNYIALKVGTANITQSTHYSNKFNSRFICK